VKSAWRLRASESDGVERVTTKEGYMSVIETTALREVEEIYLSSQCQWNLLRA
jgi:hypothetical protein